MGPRSIAELATILTYSDFIEEQARATDELVDHVRRQVIGQSPRVGLGQNWKSAHWSFRQTMMHGASIAV
jgi:hypothetical protein